MEALDQRLYDPAVTRSTGTPGAPAAARLSLTRYGHSCVLVEVGHQDGTARLLLDPGNLSEPLTDLGPVDAVLVTHSHPDHLDAEQVVRLREAGGFQVFGPAGVSDVLQDVDVPTVLVEPGTFEVAGVPVRVVENAHESIYPGVPLPANVAFEIAGRLLAPGDSLRRLDGRFEVVLAPTGAPWMKLSEAIDYVRAMAPRAVVPVHDAGLAAPHQAVHRSLMTRFAPSGTEVRILGTGERFDVDP